MKQHIGTSIRTNQLYVTKNGSTATSREPIKAASTPRTSRPMTKTSRTVSTPKTSVVERRSTAVGPPIAVITAAK